MTALIGAVLVAAPAAADADGVTLDCTYSGGPDTGYGYEATITEAGNPYSGPATVQINADPNGANTWLSSSVSVVNGAYSADVANFFSGLDPAEVGIRVIAGSANAECWAQYEPVLVDYSGSLSINAGDTAAVLADALVSPALEDEPLRAYLVVDSGSSSVDVANARLTDYGHYAILNYRPSYSRQVYIAIVSDYDGRYLGSTETFTIDVKRTTPTVITKPTSVLQGKTAAIVAAYGSSTTAGKASLQVYSGSAWKTVTTTAFTGGVVGFTRAETATSKYRVAFTPTGKSTVYTSSWTMTYLPVFSLKGPATAKKNEWVDIRLTNRWDKDGKAKLQYYSAGAWHTVRTYSLNAKESVTLSAQIKGTYRWRLTGGGFTSPSVKITVR